MYENKIVLWKTSLLVRIQIRRKLYVYKLLSYKDAFNLRFKFTVLQEQSLPHS